MYRWWLHIFLYASVFSGKHAELFSDLTGMEAMMKTERVLLDSLNTYLKNQEDQLQLLRKQYEDYNAEYTLAKNDVTLYLGNPVNAFKIIKRLLIDWKNTQRIVEYSLQMELLPEDTRKLHTFPEEKDFSSAAEGLVRLQDVYNLHASELAEGKINGVQYYSRPMTASDCFGLGRHLFELQFYFKSFEWLNIALSKYETEYNKTMDKVDILDFLAISAYAIGNFNTAVKITNEVLKIVPDHPRATKNLPIYEVTLEIVCFIFKVFQDALQMAVYYNENRKIHDGLCREELELPEFVKKKLKCRYFSGTHPFLRLAPFKLEEQYLEPYVVAFHDVMYDNEIQLIKELIHPHLELSGVHHPSLEESIISKVRISKSGWLKDQEHEVAARVSRRVAHFTGLAVESAEDLQVAVYGLAGHYETHFDFCTKDEEDEVDKRIATVLFYMSDVEEGGNTVFPDIGVSVKPEKGMALFWLNLLPSGDGNFAMRHAACPVLRGSKYVCTKWIHQAGQELKKLCTLEYEEEGTHQEFPKPVMKQAP